MREAFTANEFRGKTLLVIEQANEIIRDYQRQGFTLTLRQLYYQFVARDLIPNQQTEYKKLGATLSKARLAGLVDWDAIEDRTRMIRGGDYGYASPEDWFEESTKYYGEPRWDDQPAHIEVWIEKDALLGVIEGVCMRYRVNYFACRGSVSQSEMYTAGKRLAEAYANGKHPIVLHFGDHDPSGVHMTEDNVARLSMFSGLSIDLRRLALNMDQIRLYDPPPNPAKESDSRYADYVATYGTEESWELDALEPRVISGLIEDAIKAELDMDRWNASRRREATNREVINQFKGRFDELKDYLGIEDVDADEEPEDDA